MTRSLIVVAHLSLILLLGSFACAAQEITLQGGAATTINNSQHAYDQSVPLIVDPAEQLLQNLGQTGFLRDFGKNRINGKIRLGPYFNASSCAQCHNGNGRGVGHISYRAGFNDTVIKLSIASGHAPYPGAPIPVPRIGAQLSDHAVKPYTPIGRASILWRYSVGRYPDGTSYSLRSPLLKASLNGARFPAGTRFSIRRAPPIFGTGLIEAISAEAIQSLEDPLDLDGDGISGRANVVWDIAQNRSTLGRFGFKAGHPSLLQQIAAAYANDMGVTNPIFKLGDKRPEISNSVLEATTFYTATRSVPQARDQDNPSVVAGKEVFMRIGCVKCHAINLPTTANSITALSQQLVHPFTDLLLHDMGPGLADSRTEFAALGSEWRTTPLWGIGLTGTVLDGGTEGYLHDGRARTLEEAILWHAGEADAARSLFVNADSSERDNLIRFLRSL